MLLEFPFLCPLIAQRSPRLTFTVRRVLQRRAHSTAAPHHARTTSQPQPLSATPTTIKIPIQSSSQDHLKRSRPDPFLLVEPELSKLRQTLLQLLGSSHSSLTDIASYYFTLGGKQLRPLLVLLVSQATNGWASGFAEKLLAPENSLAKKDELDRPLSHPNILNDWNPRIPDHTASFSTVFSLSLPERFSPPPPPSPILTHQNEPYTSNLILPTQLRLAQISEMIHVASLLHDDVLDGASLRRSSPSAPFKFGNKLSVLGGDFLLGRASASLSRLGEPEVTELVSSIISNLVEGEVMQLREVDEEGKDKDLRADKGRWLAYLQKSYFKTASLMAKTARSAVVLGGARKDVEEDEKLKDVAYAYGRNIGIAFQVSRWSCYLAEA
jgi:hexaprenyl-diphosphate synthase